MFLLRGRRELCKLVPFWNRRRKYAKNKSVRNVELMRGEDEGAWKKKERGNGGSMSSKTDNHGG